MSTSSTSKLKTRVFCTLQFEGFHCWPGAPDSVAYLRDRHRHIFHVRAEKRVSHEDRDVEFITLKGQIQATITAKLENPDEVIDWSCEKWAGYLLQQHGLCRCEVSEDGENGSTVERIDE